MISLESLLSNVELSQFAQFHFIRPMWFLALFPIVGFYWFYLRKQNDVGAQWGGLISDDILNNLKVDGHRSTMVNPRMIFVLMSILSILVMAGPSWQRSPAPFFEDDSALIVVLDVSPTMDKTDIQPSRLSRAKQKIDALLKKRSSGKTALIVYSGSAHIAMPLSKDKEMMRYFLDALSGDLMPNNDIEPSVYLQPVSQLLARQDTPATVVVLTDKTDKKAIDLAETTFKENAHQMIVWGMGSTDGTSQDLSHLDVEQMTSLANVSNGQFVAFTADSEDVQAVYEKIENNLIASKDAAQPWLDEGYLLLFLILPMQLLWFRRGWTLQW